MVRGEGEVRALPDRASVVVTVDGDGASREQAYETAAKLLTAVDAVLTSEAGGLGRVVTTALVVQPRSRWRKGEEVRTGWRASRTSVVEIDALDQVGALLAQLVAAGGAVAGPAWELAASNPVHDEARRSAAEDARRRADAYAAALGLKVGNVAWVSEPGLRFGMPGMVTAVAARAMSSPPGVAMSDEPIEVNPEEMTLHASVEVAFTINDA